MAKFKETLNNEIPILNKQIPKKKENWIINHLGWLISILAILGGITAYIVIAVYTSHFSGELSSIQGHWGTFGDYFGGILNPTFSFLALIALLCTLYVQRYELKNAREEFDKAQHINSRTLEIQILAEFIKCKEESAKHNLDMFKKCNRLLILSPSQAA